MGCEFDRWEKDSFFSAAEEVQDSADRMESTYRTWIHSTKESSGERNSEEIRRDLLTALGTTKWQLEEFDRAVKPSYINSSAKDAKVRHKDFIFAVESQILKVENSLQKSTVSGGKPPQPWVHLDKGESDELVLFLSGPPKNMNKTFDKVNIRSVQSAYSLEPSTQPLEHCLDCPLHSLESKEDRFTGHRRTASAGADIGTWNISVDDDENYDPPLKKIPSVSGFLNKMEMGNISKWSNNGYRKVKTTDHPQEADDSSSHSQEFTRGIKDCYERSKSCLDECDGNYDKQFHGWYGSIQRLVQRSQYQLQFSQPLQMVFWVVFVVCSIGLIMINAV